MARSKKNKNPIQWYITTCSNGNEDTVIKNLKAKVLAMHFQEMIFDAKVIKIRTVEEEIFDDNNPNKTPPKNMRNSATIKWKTLGLGKYLKTKIIDRNKFPGYIYVKMIMNDDAWYAVRNAQNITGLVGSSGKGAKPIPITFEEEMLLSGESENPDIRVVVLPNAIIEMDRTKFDENGNLIGFEQTMNSELDADKEEKNNETSPSKNDSSKSKKVANKKPASDDLEKQKEKEVNQSVSNAEDLVSNDNVVLEKQEEKETDETEIIEDQSKEVLDKEEVVSSQSQATLKDHEEEDLNSNINDNQADTSKELEDKAKEDSSNEVEQASTFNLSKALGNINDVSKLLPNSDFDVQASSSNDAQGFATQEDPYKIGHFVEIILGEHSGIQGNVVDIDRDKKLVSVQVEIMGKETVLVLEYNQITLKK